MQYSNHISPLIRLDHHRHVQISDVICNDYTRVILNDGKPGDYIHANYVKGENLLNTFICTQGPLPNTIEDFWRMVVGEKVAHVVMLCDTVENGKTKCEQYWPNMQDQKLEFGGNLFFELSLLHNCKTLIKSQVCNRYLSFLRLRE
ncbi:unnamed protein product [Cylicostephanus goldi]|uniref:Tyrosine-protein phosphatase domain-containing protein n=1 Tax=Cylicostephanus goldi TaxID=71465 RepID=A0A3P6RQG7_CYLGO|nr:unnamed protein product [Cylicostephanus goldi]